VLIAHYADGTMRKADGTSFWGTARSFHRAALYLTVLVLWTLLTISASAMMLHGISTLPVPRPSHQHLLPPTPQDDAILAPATTEPTETLNPAAVRSLQRMLRLSPRRLNAAQREALAVDLQAALDRVHRAGRNNHRSRNVT
jgi:hypothetical protein